MTATPSQLGARALRKLGVAVVADAARPPEQAVLTSAQVASRVLVNLGVPLAEQARTADELTLASADIAPRVLLELGIPVPDDARPTAEGSIDVNDLAMRVARAVGLNPSPYQAPDTVAGYSIAQIATEALTRLGVMSPEETPSTPDQGEAFARAAGVHDIFVGMDFVTWPGDTIPAAVAEYYIIMTAQLVAPSFGKSQDMQQFAGAQAAVKDLALSGSYGQALALSKIQEAHEALNAMGLVTWAYTAIPAAYVPSYVRLGAILLAPAVGYQQDAPDKQLDRAGWDAAVEDVRKLTLINGALARALTAVQEVHDELNDLGLVTWPLDQIPSSLGDTMVKLAAAEMAPQFDKQVDPALMQSNMERVRRVLLAGPTGYTMAQTAVQTIEQELNDLGLVTWTAEQVPASVADVMVQMASMQMTPGFGRDFDAKAHDYNLDRIRKISMGGPAGQALAVQKVLAVHYSLEARGRTRWTLYDLPAYAEEPYVFMAATWLAPEVGVKADPNWWQAAEMDLMRIVALPTDYEPIRGAYF